MKNTNEFKAIDKVIMFSFNYDYHFIENAFNDYLAKHLRNKFSDYCQRYNNSQTAFMYLYTSLSNSNKRILVDYILSK